MRMFSRAVVFVGGVSLSAFAQTHKVATTETVVRAVGVYEWTGDLAKPNANRLIPISIFIDRHLEDAGLYLARPVPFALQSGDIYELEQAGVAKGNVELVYARHLQAVNAAEAYDDGWFGYGSFKPLPIPKKPIARKASTHLAKVESSASDTAKPSQTGDASAGTDSGAVKKADDAKPVDAKTVDADPDRPTMKRRNAENPSSTDDKSVVATSASTDDPDRPTMKRRTDTATDASDPNGGSPTQADDPDRPTMKRRTETASDTSATNGGSPAPADDPDRPTLKRHSAEDAKKAAKAKSEASVTGSSESLNDDPDRPNLHRGKPTHAMTEADLPKLSGHPEDLHQMVAVSDATNRPVHDFARPWEDDEERAAILTKMQAIARAQLAVYGAPTAAKPQPAAVRKTGSKRSGTAAAQSAQAQLLDEQLKGYSLSYGDVPTFVYQAQTPGTGAELRYVTIVAQRDAQGEPAMALHVVTDASHLDRTARMRLVDAVDVDASNRACLVFELGGQTSRQFGVYRVLGQHAEQIFNTGTTQ